MEGKPEFERILDTINENFDQAIEKVFTREKFMIPSETREIQLTKESLNFSINLNPCRI
jgi:hypothetical protein